MTVAIYTITNTANNKRYVGISKDLTRRWKEHSRADGVCAALHASMNKHGIDKFKFEHIADAFTWSDACALEKEIICNLNTKSPNGYNLTYGGDGTYGFKHTAEECQRRSERCPTRNPEIRKLIADKQRGKKRPNMTGLKNSMYGKTGLKSHMLKHVVIATSVVDGKQITLAGAKDIEQAGFNRAHVYACAKQQRKTHKNHTFEFKGEVL